MPIYDFTALTNPLGPSGKARTAMRKALKAVHIYPDEQFRLLRRYLAKREGIGEENILFANGSSRIFSLAIGRLKVHRVALPSPVPDSLMHLFKNRGVEIDTVPTEPLQDFLPTLEQLIKAGEVNQMLVVPNPHPLTGSVIPPDMLDSLITTLNGADVTVVIDEALGEFAGIESPVRQAVGAGNCLILRSFSFFHALAGMRLGYTIGHPDLLRKIGEEMEPWPINAIALSASLASLKDKGYKKRTLDFMRQEKTYLRDKLAKIRAVSVVDTRCNFLLLRLEESMPDLISSFQNRHILIEQFADTQGQLWLRLPVRRHKENAHFLRTIGALVR